MCPIAKNSCRENLHLAKCEQFMCAKNPWFTVSENITVVRILTWFQSWVHHRRDHSITPLTIRVHFKLGAYSWFSSSVGCCIVSMGHYGRQASLPFQQEQSQDSRWIQYPSILNYSRPCLCIQSFFPAHTCISRTEYPPKVHPLAVLNFKKTCIETIKPVSLRY